MAAMAHPLDETFSRRRSFEVSSAEDDSFFGLFWLRRSGDNERSGKKNLIRQLFISYNNLIRNSSYFSSLHLGI
jgi:hypothetical protein